MNVDKTFCGSLPMCHLYNMSWRFW